MYAPKQFQEERPEVLAGAIRDIQLAALVTATGDTYHATHVPMVLKEEDGRWVLEAHVARPNTHGATLVDGPLNSLAIFQGPQAYISPSWYETKQLHGKVVPTWDYIAVHASGPLERVEDEDWLIAHINDLTNANEAGREEPWSVSDAPDDFIRKLSRAIIGLRLKVEKVEGSWKMTQNRSEGDRIGTREGLSASPRAGDQAVAEILRELEAERAKPADDH